MESAGESGGRVTVKPPGEVRSDSLQNPSDPDATYRGHKGQGYQAQVMETCIPAADANGEKGPGLFLITHVAVEPAHASDANALIPSIEDASERGLGPTEVLADSLYGSEKNVAAATAMGTEVVEPVPGGENKGKSARLSEFALTEKGGIATCPKGTADRGRPPRESSRGGLLRRALPGMPAQERMSGQFGGERIRVLLRQEAGQDGQASCA
jgi:hypothetical protein